MFEPIDASAFASVHRRTKLHAAILGESTELQDVVASACAVADCSDPLLGETVQHDVIEGDSFVSLGDRGVACIGAKSGLSRRAPWPTCRTSYSAAAGTRVIRGRWGSTLTRPAGRASISATSSHDEGGGLPVLDV